MRFGVFIDGQAVGARRGSDVDDRTFEIEFLGAGAEANYFTFG